MGGWSDMMCSWSDIDPKMDPNGNLAQARVAFMRSGNRPPWLDYDPALHIYEWNDIDPKMDPSGHLALARVAFVKSGQPLPWLGYDPAMDPGFQDFIASPDGRHLTV